MKCGIEGGKIYYMNELNRAVAAYITAIKSTEIYQNYVKERDKIKQDPELKAQIDEFRKLNYVLQTAPDTDFVKIENFEKEYSDFRENPLVDDYLSAELALCRMLQKANLQITEAIDFE